MVQNFLWENCVSWCTFHCSPVNIVMLNMYLPVPNTLAKVWEVTKFVCWDGQQDQHGASVGASLARAFREMRASIFDYRDNIPLLSAMRRPKTVLHL